MRGGGHDPGLRRRARRLRGAARRVLPCRSTADLVITAPPRPHGPRLRSSDGVVVALTEEGLFLEAVAAEAGEGLYAFARRLCGDEQVRRRRSPRPTAGPACCSSGALPRPVRLSSPNELAGPCRAGPLPRGQGAGRRLAPPGARGRAAQRESLWQLSHWFTGTGENFRAIREYNELWTTTCRAAPRWSSPRSCCCRPSAPSCRCRRRPITWTTARTRTGEYAVYRLRPGEALYSSVVVRFTGRVYAEDVNALRRRASRERSGIPDVTDIPIGYRVKIPFDVLQPEFLPEGHPQRVEYEASLRASAQFSNQVRAQGLAGITVILDAGHGGQDSGATMGGVWESLYVYDIALRVKRLLETHTAAEVVLTTRDGAAFRIHDTDVLPFSRGHCGAHHAALPDRGRQGRGQPALVPGQQRLPAGGPGRTATRRRWCSSRSTPTRSTRRCAAPWPTSRRPTCVGGSFGKTGAVYASRKEVQESADA